MNLKIVENDAWLATSVPAPQRDRSLPTTVVWELRTGSPNNVVGALPAVATAHPTNSLTPIDNIPWPVAPNLNVESATLVQLFSVLAGPKEIVAEADDVPSQM
jgi:hypothetical protein